LKVSLKIPSLGWCIESSDIDCWNIRFCFRDNRKLSCAHVFLQYCDKVQLRKNVFSCFVIVGSFFAVTSSAQSENKPLSTCANAPSRQGFFVFGEVALGEKFDSVESAPKRVSTLQANVHREKLRSSREFALDDYDFADRLVKRSYTSGTVVSMSYDTDGNRIRKTVTDGVVNTTVYYLVDTNNLTGYRYE